MLLDREGPLQGRDTDFPMRLEQRRLVSCNAAKSRVIGSASVPAESAVLDSCRWKCAARCWLSGPSPNRTRRGEPDRFPHRPRFRIFREWRKVKPVAPSRV